MSKICPECGKSFVGSTKYCSYRCCKRHNRKAKEIKHPVYAPENLKCTFKIHPASR